MGCLTNMKEIYYEQEGWCGPSVLQWVAEQERLDFTQSRLAEVMGTTNKEGTSHPQMVEGLKHVGLKGFTLEGLRIEELGILLKDHHVIVNWMDGEDEENDGHYSVLKEVREDKVYLEDKVINIEDFERKWYDIVGGKRVNRWALVVYKK